MHASIHVNNMLTVAVIMAIILSLCCCFSNLRELHFVRNVAIQLTRIVHFVDKKVHDS